MVFVCHVALQGHVIKALNDFIVRAPQGMSLSYQVL